MTKITCNFNEALFPLPLAIHSGLIVIIAGIWDVHLNFSESIFPPVAKFSAGNS